MNNDSFPILQLVAEIKNLVENADNVYERVSIPMNGTVL